MRKKGHCLQGNALSKASGLPSFFSDFRSYRSVHLIETFDPSFRPLLIRSAMALFTSETSLIAVGYDERAAPLAKRKSETNIFHILLRTGSLLLSV